MYHRRHHQQMYRESIKIINSYHGILTYNKEVSNDMSKVNFKSQSVHNFYYLTVLVGQNLLK